MAHISMYWRLPVSSLQSIQHILLEFYGLPIEVIDPNFVHLPVVDREHVGRRRQRTNRSTPKGERVCRMCGSTESLERHHLISPLIGGRNVKANLVWLCTKCHNEYHEEVGCED